MIRRIKEFLFDEPLVVIDAKGGFHKMRKVVIYQNEVGSWECECPSLPGCISIGRTREESIDNMRDTIGDYVDSLLEDDLIVPKDYANMEIIRV